MVDASSLLDTILQDSTVCSRCFSKSMNSQQRSGALGGDTPCGKQCGQLGINMGDELISRNEAEHRARKLVKRLDERDVDVDEELLVKTAKSYTTSYPPQELFQTAIEVGLGDREPPVFKEESPNTQDRRGQDEPVEPFDELTERPIPVRLFEQLEEKESINSFVDRFETPSGMNDIVYIIDQNAFENEFSVDLSGEHSIQTAASVAVEHNWSQISSINQVEFTKWLDELDNSTENAVLSQAVIRASKRNEPDPNKDALRGSSIWPIIKQRFCQPLLGEIQKSNKEHLSTTEITELVPFRDKSIHRAIESLRENGTLKRDSEGIRYSGDETSFDPENAQRWTDEN